PVPRLTARSAASLSWTYQKNNYFLDVFSPRSSSVNTKREPSNSSVPRRSQLILYSRVSCLPTILIFFGRSVHNFSTFSGFFVIKSDLRLFIRYFTATFLCTWPSTGICSFPVSIVN